MGWFHLWFFGILIPIAAVRSRKKVLGTAEKPVPLPDRKDHFRKTAANLAVFTALSLLTAWQQKVILFPRAWPPLSAVIAGLVMYVLTVTLMRPRWRRAVEKRLRIVHLFMPDNAVERTWWIAVSVLAGVGEEITWRGVQATLVFNLAGDLTAGLWIAAIVTSIPFAIAHFIQGWKSVAVIFVMALGFHALVWLAGSLYVAMAVHVAYDITAGLSYGRLGRELGYAPALERSEVAQAEPSKI